MHNTQLSDKCHAMYCALQRGVPILVSPLDFSSPDLQCLFITAKTNRGMWDGNVS